jgi:hypothetical protein
VSEIPALVDAIRHELARYAGRLDARRAPSSPPARGCAGTCRIGSPV